MKEMFYYKNKNMIKLYRNMIKHIKNQFQVIVGDILIKLEQQMLEKD